jgi:hypothetical protein
MSKSRPVVSTPVDATARSSAREEEHMQTNEGTMKRSTALRTATGKDYDGWFTALDEWGAPRRSYTEIAQWLTDANGVSDWWAQKLIVEYEQSRGLREQGVRRDGTFTVGVTRTIDAPVGRIAEAFRDAGIRAAWLPGVVLVERPSRSRNTLRFDVGRDGTRLAVTLAETPGGKVATAVEESRLPDGASAGDRKTFLAERLDALRSLLETR